MRILKTDVKNGFKHILCENQEDLWELSYIVEGNDIVRGTTERKIKIGGDDVRNQKVIRKKMTLSLKAEKTEYANEVLKVLGTIVDGPDDIARGDHHSINFAEGDSIGITKPSGTWASWQEKKIDEACKAVKENILVVLFDREEALFVRLEGQGQHIISRLQGDVAKKDQEGTGKGNFWNELTKELLTLHDRYNPKSIIAASPAFWKDYLQKAISGQGNTDLSKKIVYATVSDTNEQAIGEVLKRPELKMALAMDRTAQENKAVAEVLTAMAKDNAAYGIAEVEEKANEGNIKTLLVTTTYLMKEREKEEDYKKLEQVMHNAESGKANILIISTPEASKQIDGIGGIAGIKRWQ